MLKSTRDEKGAVFKCKSHWIKASLALAGYCVCAFIGLIQFVIMNKYITWMVSSYEKGMSLMIALLVTIPIIFLVFAYLCLQDL